MANHVFADSIFFPEGLEEVDPPMIHYLHIGCWATKTVDYYRHRRPHPEENPDRLHWPVFLHRAQPRDRFVFLVLPVSGGMPVLTVWDRIMKAAYGVAPRFAIRGRAETNYRVGVESIEVLHDDITAMDFTPALTCDRLTIETRSASSRWFASRREAEAYYRVGGQPSAETDSVKNATEGCNAGRLPPNNPASHDENDESRSPADELLDDLSPDAHVRELADKMLVIFSQDPNMTTIMRELLQPTSTAHGSSTVSTARHRFQPFTASVASQQRLLSLYEAGIPSWAVFFSRYGLPYRRWFRIIAVTVLNVWPFIALIVGLYDLYKHMPYLREWMEPFTEWMENHFTLRVSVMVAYVFTLMLQALDSVVKIVKSIAAVVGFMFSPLYPLWQLVLLLRGPLMGALTLLITVGTPFVILLKSIGTMLTAVVTMPWTGMQLATSLMSARSAMEPVAAGVKSASYTLSMWQRSIRFWQQVARPVKNLLKAVYDGIVHVGTQIVRREASLRNWYKQQYHLAKAKLQLMAEAVDKEFNSPTWRSAAVFAIIAVVAGLLFQFRT